MARRFKKEFFKDGEIVFGVFYPTRYIIAVFDTATQADQAVTAVKQVRCDARHATLQQVLERAHEFLRERSPVQRLEGAFSSDEKEAMRDYISLAEQGRHFVDVHVPEESEVAQVESILEAHQAHDMHYYGEWDLVDLSSNEPPR